MFPGPGTPTGGVAGCCSLVNTAQGSQSGSGSSIASSSFSATAGNLLIVACRAGNGTGINTPTDTGDTFVQIGSTLTSNSSTIGEFALFYAKNISSQASQVVTCNYAGSNPFIGATVLQFSGANTSTPLDTGSSFSFSATSTTSSPTTSSYSTSVASERCAMAYTVDNINNTFTGGSGYSQEVIDSAEKMMGMADQQFSSTQSSITASVSDGTQHWYVIGACFKA